MSLEKDYYDAQVRIATIERLCQQQHEALENLAHGKSGKSRGSEWDDAESALDAYAALFSKTGDSNG